MTLITRDNSLLARVLVVIFRKRICKRCQINVLPLCQQGVLKFGKQDTKEISLKFILVSGLLLAS